METTVTVVMPGRASREDAVLRAPTTACLGQVVTHLRSALGATGSDAISVDGVTPDLATPLTDSPLRDGCVVTLGTPGRAVPAAPGHTCLELRVVAGPSAGEIHQLRMGSTVIGRDSSRNSVRVRLEADSLVSRRHAVISIDGEHVTVCDAGSTNGSSLDGRPLSTTPVPLRPGARLQLGESTVVLAVPDDPPALLVADADGALTFNRPPRLHIPASQAAAEVAFPTPPDEPMPQRLPVIALVVPVLAGVALAALMRRPEYLAFTLLSPLMMAGQWAADRFGRRRQLRQQRLQYGADLAAAAARWQAALLAEQQWRRTCAPDSASLFATARGPANRLWERRRGDVDFLVLRLGHGPARARTIATGNPPEQLTRHVDDVPITVPLAEIGVLGLAGPRAQLVALARSLVVQLTTLHSPNDLALALLVRGSACDDWEWSRWLPHLRADAGLPCQLTVGLDAETVSTRVAELAALVERRCAARAPGGGCPPADTGPVDPSAIVLLVDGVRALRRTPGLADVLARGPDVGVFAICLDGESAALAEECRAVAVLTGASGTRLDLRGCPPADAVAPSASEVSAVVFDGGSIDWAEHVARALAPLRDEVPRRRDGALPARVRWLEVANLTADTLAATLVDRWRGSPGAAAHDQPRSAGTRAVLGVAANGAFVVDLARDGPHALIAGTTGSGKSELLQTLVAALAAANRPDELTFVLVDYKGGAAFGACAALPHTVGLVTDLDGALVERALVSLSAELRRRETLLAERGAADIAEFRGTGGRLARLVIVVDEFASLAEELPDFVRGLIGIAQRGRSLGVHLVLATQRPEGVVSADIRANTNLRICLAVTRETESRDVIDAPNAAWISRTTPGRAYARTGHGELHAFQTARVGAAVRLDDASTIGVRLSPFRSTGHPAPAIENCAVATRSDLDVVVEASRVAAKYLEIETPAPPWLPPLPDLLDLLDLLDLPPCGMPLHGVIGVRDLPLLQAREPLVFDLTRMGHLLVAGGPRSGRTTALRTLVGSLTRATSAAQLHVYLLDFAGGALGTVSELPHCGAATGPHEPDRVRRMLAVLADEVATRRAALATALATSVAGDSPASSDANEPTATHLLLLIDGWEGFVSASDEVDAGATVEAVLRLAREGPSVGVHLAISADRAGLVGRLASAIDNRLVLRLSDRSDYALVGVPARAVPTQLPPGRGYWSRDLALTQVAVLAADDGSAVAQSAALSRIADFAKIRDRQLPRARRPRRIDPYPEHVELAGLLDPRAETDNDAAAAPAGDARIVLGVGGDELHTVRVDLRVLGPGFVVAGSARSGRSSTLATIAIGLRRQGWRVLAVTPRASPLRAVADEVYDLRGSRIDTASLEDAAVGWPAAQPEGRIAVLVDDAELARDAPVAMMIEQALHDAPDRERIVVVAGNTDDLSIGLRGFVVEARRARCGLLLAPRGPLDGELLGVRLARGSGPGTVRPGRGVLVTHGAPNRTLQVALSAPADVPGCRR